MLATVPNVAVERHTIDATSVPNFPNWPTESPAQPASPYTVVTYGGNPISGRRLEAWQMKCRCELFSIRHTFSPILGHANVARRSTS
jgi:hypothetical protein